MRDFLLKTLLRSTTACVYVCSLVNEKGQKDGPTERHILTRDLDHIEQFVGQWDVPGRGTFISVSTLKPNSRRVKSNAMELVFYHVDVDFKSIDITVDEAFEALKNCTHPPTLIVSSGHGLHAYWMLSHPIVSNDEAEETQKQAARVFAGDKQVAQRVALMRLPGSHNTKNGEWLDVKVTYESNHYYDNEEIKEWFANAEIIIKRKGTVEDFKPEPLNPFAQYAEQYGFKAPIDVDKRLAEMEFQGPGDTAIHATQVAVTASMLSAGVGIEEVVEKVLTATKAVAPENWDWKAEEKTIRGMCKGWMRKLQKKEETVSNVVSINEARAARQRPTDDEEEPEEGEAKGKPKKGIVHVVLGNGFLEALKRRGWGILRIGEDTWRCFGGVWTLLTPGLTKEWLDGELEEGCRALGIVSTQKVINEARAWIMRNPDIRKDSVNWDAHGKIATQSGLLDPETMEIEELKPEHYVTMRIECPYDPEAKCPAWLRALDDMFPNDEATIKAIQETAGSGLIPNRNRNLRRALVFVGQSYSGKSGLIDVLSGLFTKTPNTTSFSFLENAFGMMDFLRNVPWVLHEAFSQGKWETSDAVKLLLSADPVNINIKNAPVVHHAFKMPVFWGTNVSPQFKDSSYAIENRLRVIRCLKVFDRDNLIGVAKEAQDKGYQSIAHYILSTEMPGLLNWFIEGMRRASKRGNLTETDDMRQAAQEMHYESSRVAGFLDECITLSVDHMVSQRDLHATYSQWWKLTRGDGKNHTPSNNVLIKDLEMATPLVVANRKMTKYKNDYYVAGLALNETGLEMWTAMSNESAQSGKGSLFSSKAEEVNKDVPKDWFIKAPFKRMLDAHTAKKEK